MGAFLYVRKAPAAGIAGVRRRYRGALASLAAKHLTEAQAVDGGSFVLFLFQKRFVKTEQAVLFPGGDFIAAVGTLFYKGRTGAGALRRLYEDFGGPADLFSDLSGQFAVVMRKNGVLSCFNDYFGIYHVYADEQGDVVSSSFLAVLSTLKEVRPSLQAFYEYVFDGATYGGETLIQGIRRLDGSRIHALQPRAPSVSGQASEQVPEQASNQASKQCRLAQAAPPASFDDQVDAANADLVAYFEMLRAAFGERLLLGFSGGYDSRLLLAAALKAGVRPRLFVGGAAGSADVRVAKAVAAGLDLDLEHLDTAALSRPPAERFPQIVAEKLDHYDGAGIRGAINDGEEYLWRCRRMASAPLELNGGGGEIYRDFWKIPNRRIPIREFVAKVLEFKNLDKIAATAPRFDRAGYRESLVQKLKVSLRTTSDSMDREQVASLYTILRSNAFAGPTAKEMNLLGHSLLPFAEPRLSLPSYRIPLEHKVYGRFEAEMIRRLDPALAAFPSSYGHRFTDPLPLKKRVKETLDRHCRNVVPLPLIFLAYSLLRKKNQYNSSPYYYSQSYLETLVDPRKLRVADYVDMDRIRALDDPFVLSRVLAVEVLLQTRGPARQGGTIDDTAARRAA
jgi:asparagine synthase (glutamine-hydrolysing)